MNESPENKSAPLSTLESMILDMVDIRIDSIELFMAITEMDKSELIRMNDYLEESYRSFLPKLNTENLYSKYSEFLDVIKEADCMLASSISKSMKNSVGGSYTLTQDEIEGWNSALEILKKQTIPRMKEEGLDDKYIKLLEGAILQSEIKIAYDLGEDSAE